MLEFFSNRIHRQNFLRLGIAGAWGTTISNGVCAHGSSTAVLGPSLTGYVLHRKSGTFMYSHKNGSRRAALVFIQPALVDVRRVEPRLRKTACPSSKQPWIAYDDQSWKTAD